MRAAPLSDLVTSQRAGYWGEGAGALDLDVSVIRNGDVHESGEIWWPTVPLRGFRIEEAAKARIGRDDIVITTSADCGRVAHIAVEPPTVTCASNFVRVLRFDASRVSPRYVFHFMHRAQFAASLAPFIRGTAMKNLALADALSHVEVPLPPIPEQIRISGLLDRAEALRAKRRAALAQLDTLTQSIFLDMFGDPQVKGWAMATVAEVAESRSASIRTGPFGSQLLHGEFVDQGIAVLGIDNVVSNEFRWDKRRFITTDKYRHLKRYTVRPGDVLITIMGTCGRCAIVPDDVPLAINTKHLCCITLDQRMCLPAFLHAYFLRHPLARRYLERTAKGAIMAGLNTEIIKAMPIPLPPVGLQQEFVARVASVGQLNGSHRLSLAQLDALFASLQQRAFSGRL